MQAISKEEARNLVRSMRKRIPPEVFVMKSGILCRKLIRSDEWQSAKTVLLYASLPGEVVTDLLFEDAFRSGRTVAVPKVTGSEIVFSRITSMSDLSEGTFRIPEPREIVPFDFEQPLIVLPGVAFDVTGNRVGYGRGFYDRYLSAHPGLKNCAVAYDFSVFPQILADEWDVRTDCLITEKREYRNDESKPGRGHGSP